MNTPGTAATTTRRQWKRWSEQRRSTEKKTPQGRSTEKKTPRAAPAAAHPPAVRRSCRPWPDPPAPGRAGRARHRTAASCAIAPAPAGPGRATAAHQHVGALPRDAPPSPPPPPPPPPSHKCFRPVRQRPSQQRTRLAAAPLPPLPPGGSVWEKGRGRPRHTRRCRTVAARRAQRCVVASPPSLFAPRTWGRCVSRGRSVSERAQKRDQVAGFLPPSPLEGEQKTKPSCSLEELHLVQLFIFVCKKCV